MRMSEAMRRTGNAARATGGAVRSSARVGASATRKTGGLVHRVTGASGAGRTGLSTLIELTAAGGAGDAFVAVSLAGTIFFSTSVDQARGRVVLFLLVTMAPFAVLAPFIGPRSTACSRVGATCWPARCWLAACCAGACQPPSTAR